MNKTLSHKYEGVYNLQDLRAIVKETEHWPAHSDVEFEYGDISVAASE
ncbi:hypothetical protein JRC04_05275 [Mycolicibacterium sp. S2-37]|nr:hypothetical protein [Mycolicibacterium sp. S2-37]MBO0676866.1 hypothetical protein [Mycolicibacterium sp. S2-37]